MTYSDLEIEDRIRNGDANTVVKYIYDSLFSNIRNLIVSKGGSHENAKDIFQDTVIILVQNILERKYENGINIKAFMLTVSQRIWIDKIRKDKNLTFADDFRVFDYAEESKTEVNIDTDSERSALIDSLLTSIGEKCKTMIRLVIYNGLSMQEVAEELEYSSVDSAKTQHYKCRQKLIKKYRDNSALKELLRSE